jgi:hypothetical protein
VADIIIQQGSIGTVFEIEITGKDGTPVDVSLATVKTIKFRKPDKSVVSKNASFLTDGVNGIIIYSTETGVIDQPGIWSMQAIITIPDGYYPSQITNFTVKGNL